MQQNWKEEHQFCPVITGIQLAQASSSVLRAQIWHVQSFTTGSKFKGLLLLLIILICPNIYLVHNTVTSKDEVSQGGITCLKVVVGSLIELINVCKTFSNARIKGFNTKIQGLPINYWRKEQANGSASRRIALNHLGSGLTPDLHDSLRRPVPYS